MLSVKARKKAEKDYGFKSECLKTTGGGVYTYSNAYITYVVFLAPTGNCQLFSIGCLINLLAAVKDTKILLSHFYGLAKAMGKPCVIIDIEEDYMDTIHKLFGTDDSVGHIISENPYTNTMGNEMCLFHINITGAEPPPPDDDWDDDDNDEY